MKNIKYPAPCKYKKSCGYEICMEDMCKEYEPKKRGEPYVGEEYKPKSKKSEG